MALEEAIVALTKVTEKNVALMEQLIAAAGGKASKAAPAEKATETKTEKASSTKAKKAKTPTVAEVRTAYSAYLDGGPAAERKARISEIKKVNDHFGIKGLAELPVDKTVEALEYLESLKAGEEPEFKADGDADEAGDDESGEDSPI